MAASDEALKDAGLDYASMSLDEQRKIGVILGSGGGAQEFSEVAADLLRIGIDGADDFNGLLLAHQLHDGRADGADTILDGANFLFHVEFAFLSGRSAHRSF